MELRWANPCTPGEAEGRLQVSILPAAPPEEGGNTAFTLTAVADEEAARRIGEGFGPNPTPRGPAGTSAQTSVSALAKPARFQLRRRPCFYSSGLTAAERGTAMHRFLQLASLPAAAQNTEAEIARLAGKGCWPPKRQKPWTAGPASPFFVNPPWPGACVERAASFLREYGLHHRPARWPNWNPACPTP